MPEIELRSPNGALVRIVGASDELEDLRDFVLEHSEALLETVSGVRTGAATEGPTKTSAMTAATAGDLDARLQAVGASTDIDRLTVMAHFAVEQGQKGLLPDLALQWYTELGIPKPTNLASALGNAKSRGLIRSTKEGWVPTTTGENFAVHGVRRTVGRRKPRSR